MFVSQDGPSSPSPERRHHGHRRHRSRSPLAVVRRKGRALIKILLRPRTALFCLVLLITALVPAALIWLTQRR
jgi:hypothetical protein